MNNEPNIASGSKPTTPFSQRALEIAKLFLRLFLSVVLGEWPVRANGDEQQLGVVRAGEHVPLVVGLPSGALEGVLRRHLRIERLKNG